MLFYKILVPVFNPEQIVVQAIWIICLQVDFLAFSIYKIENSFKKLKNSKIWFGVITFVCYIYFKILK